MLRYDSRICEKNEHSLAWPKSHLQELKFRSSVFHCRKQGRQKGDVKEAGNGSPGPATSRSRTTGGSPGWSAHLPGACPQFSLKAPRCWSGRMCWQLVWLAVLAFFWQQLLGIAAAEIHINRRSPSRHQPLRKLRHDRQNHHTCVGVQPILEKFRIWRCEAMLYQGALQLQPLPISQSCNSGSLG